MTIKFSSLGSGSGGNSYWVAGGGMEILVDFGLSRVQTIARLQNIGASIDAIEAIVCTHAHRDHFISLRPIGASAAESSRLAYERTKNIPFYMTKRALDFAMAMQRPTGRKLDCSRWLEIPEKSAVHLVPHSGEGEGLQIAATPVFHDCPGTVALKISAGNLALGIVTDVGLATDELAAAMQGVDALIIEFNHDPAMLISGPYPRKVKKRIQGNYGHLSNDSAAALLEKIIHPGLKYIGLAHISQKNNKPEMAIDAARSVQERAGSAAEIFVCSQNFPSGVKEISA